MKCLSRYLHSCSLRCLSLYPCFRCFCLCFSLRSCLLPYRSMLPRMVLSFLAACFSTGSIPTSSLRRSSFKIRSSFIFHSRRWNRSLMTGVKGNLPTVSLDTLTRRASFHVIALYVGNKSLISDVLLLL